MVQAIDHADVHPREPAHDLERLAGGGGEVGAAAHRREHPVQRFQLAVAPLERHARAVRRRPGPGGPRAAGPAAGRNASTTPASTTDAGRQQGEELQQQALLGAARTPAPTAPTQRPPSGDVTTGSASRRTAKGSSATSVAPTVAARDQPLAGRSLAAGRERPVSRDEDHRRPRGEPVQERRRAPRRAGPPPPCPGRPAGSRPVGALHRRGDQEVRLAARQPQGQDRLGRRRARPGGSAAGSPAPAPGACRARHGS